MAYSTCHACNISIHKPDDSLSPGECPQCAAMMSWLIAPPTHEELPTVSDEKPHGLKSVHSDLDEDETLFDPKAMDEQPTQQFAHAKTRDSSTKRLDSSILSYDESNVEPEIDESFSLFADVQPQLETFSPR